MREPFRADRPAVAELAAGGVVHRRDDRRLLLLHDPREDRWCFPKGHVEAGESLRAAAQREIEEETGLREIEVGEELVEVHYRFFQASRDRNVIKTVVYFLVTAGDAEGRPEDGFDALRWVLPAEAERLVPYEADREVLRALAARG